MKAQQVTKKLGALRSQIEQDEQLNSMKEDLTTYLLLLDEEFSDELFNEAVSELEDMTSEIEKKETGFLLSGKYDLNNAILTLHPGAGGTESQDWAEMLFRMYKRWSEQKGFTFRIVDYLPGDEAGIKSVTVEVEGEFAYGQLKAENGVHRLVRISPFNAQGKRQTSFASVFCYPEVDDDIDIEINPKDLKIDTYRASGAGGQHVNTTDSAVRITHLPTNIVVQCQNERSQIKNKATAMKMLKSRLNQHYEEIREKERQKTENAKTDIGWGNQIRSYVFHPYQMVKDHRTNFEVGNASGVMDGNLDGFIQEFLKMSARNRKKQ